MRILLAAHHRYPAFRREGTGLRPPPLVSGSGQHLHDLLAKGLAELGQEVFYLLPRGVDTPLPAGVQLCHGDLPEVDVVHGIARRDQMLSPYEDKVPRITTCHVVPRLAHHRDAAPDPNWVFVSRFLARRAGGRRFIYNGVDPADYLYREDHDNYLLFMTGMKEWRRKGLPFALHLSRTTGRTLMVAGGAAEASGANEIAQLCREHGAHYLGDVRGRAKAELLAGAAALILPSELPEGGPLCIAEALLSGTPALVSPVGGCPEMLPEGCGALCSDESQWREALNQLPHFAPQDCRDQALKRFHYLRMARDYLALYRSEIQKFSRYEPAREEETLGFSFG